MALPTGLPTSWEDAGPSAARAEDDDPEVCDPENQGDLSNTPTPTDSGYPYEGPGTPTVTLDETSTPTLPQQPTGTLTGTFTPEPTAAEASTPVHQLVLDPAQWFGFHVTLMQRGKR